MRRHQRELRIALFAPLQRKGRRQHRRLFIWLSLVLLSHIIDVKGAFIGSGFHATQIEGRFGRPYFHKRDVTSLEAVDQIVESASVLTNIAENPWMQYAFMFPVAIVVATCCQLAGIGGAALFSPIFLLLFPLLGPTYPLPSSAQAIASALLTEVFGFSSGFSGYLRRGLVDGNIAQQYIKSAAPAALAGALCLGVVAADAKLLRGVYGCLMLGLSVFLAFTPPPAELVRRGDEECVIDGSLDTNSDYAGTCSLTAADGREFQYRAPPEGSAVSIGATAFGGFLTGLLGVGVGEVVLPQLVRTCCMALPLAAGTSVATVVATAAAAAVVQFSSLANNSGGDIMSVVPWRLVCWTIPGVLIGGQVAPALAGRLPDATIQRAASAVFLLVGFSFLVSAMKI